MSERIIRYPTTVLFDNSMSTEQIQSLIDAQPKWIDRRGALIFQFSDGTYSLTRSLRFWGFGGGGYMHIRGNMSESGLHTDQAVFLDFSGNSCSGLNIYNCWCSVGVYNLKITTTSADNQDALDVYNCSGSTEVLYNYFRGTSAVNGGIGTYFSGTTRGRCYQNYYSQYSTAVAASDGAQLSEWDNDDVATNPTNARWSIRGALIGYYSSGLAGSNSTTYGGDGASGRIYT